MPHSLISLVLILLVFAALPSSRTIFIHYHCDNTYGNYTSNSTYHQNLNTLLSNISSNTTHLTYGFSNLTSGTHPDKVNGIAFCGADASLDDCHSCLRNATTSVISSCTTQKEAILWYENCMVRYTDRSIFGVMEDKPLFWIRNKFRALNQSDFNTSLSDLLTGLVNTAAGGNSTFKFAIGKAYVSTFVTIYASTQCTPDLSQLDCYNCLSESISSLEVCCMPYQGARFFRPSCKTRYETYQFSNLFDTLASEAPALAPSKSALSIPPILGRGKGSTTPKVVAAVVVAISLVCVLFIAVFFFGLRKNRRKWNKASNESEHEDEISSTETLQFAYDDIRQATQDFAEVNRLGRGGFGTVYKGVLANGQDIAVKRLARNSNQGEEEFTTEVQLVSKLQHRNLVKLFGFSIKGDERLLIYEFAPNASLDHTLFGTTRHVSLDWKARYNIIGGIARGLLYLHEDSRIRIIHRDLKASNILLDADLNPKIADFGMARLFQADQTHADTGRIAGTCGYMPPEYVYQGIFSVKSDVYSFGILVLEIVRGQRNSTITAGEGESHSSEDLVAMVWRNWREGTLCEAVDSALGWASSAEITRCVQIGLLCVQADPANRPAMSIVNLMLSSESMSIPVPSQPAYVLHTPLQTSNRAQEEPITELHPR